MSKAVDKLWITCGVIPKKAVDKGGIYPQKNYAIQDEYYDLP